MVLSALFGATVPSISKIALEVFSPLETLLARVALSSALFIVLFAIIRKPYSFLILQKTWKFSLLLLLNFVCMIVSLRYIPTALIPVVYATVPFITVIINRVLKTKHKVNSRRLTGILIGFAGVFLATVSRGISTVTIGVVFGVVCILTGSVAFSLYTIVSKKFQQNTHPLHLTYSATLVATIILFPFVGLNLLLTPHVYQQLTLRHISALLATGLIGTVLFYSIYQYTIKHSDAITASLFTYIQPIFAVALSIILLGERVNVIFILGAIATLFGAYLATNERSISSQNTASPST